MIANISEFKFSEAILKELCRNKGCNFIDIPVSFEEKIEKTLFINKKPKNIAHTMYLIISKYIEKSDEILDKPLNLTPQEKSDFLIRLANLLRGFVYVEKSLFSPMGEMSVGSLYHKSLIWLIMKDIICPVYHLELKNIKTVSDTNSYIDIARYYKEGEIKNKTTDGYSFVFINEISNIPVLNAFILVETLKAYDLNPTTIFKDIFESDLYDKFYGLLDLLFNNSEIQEFITTLTTLTGINLRDFLAKKALSNKVIKTSQQWWNLAIIDALLEPVRGSDWSSHEGIEDRAKAFWNRVEKIKQQKKANNKEPEIPFDTLLRLKSEEMVNKPLDPTISIQSLLSSKRVW